MFQRTTEWKWKKAKSKPKKLWNMRMTVTAIVVGVFGIVIKGKEKRTEELWAALGDLFEYIMTLIALFSVDHLSHPVVSCIAFHLNQFAAFAYAVNRFISVAMQPTLAIHQRTISFYYH